MKSKKGKEVAGKGSGGGKTKYDDDKTGGGRRKRNRSVLQFFEDSADVDDYDSSDDSIFDDLDFMDEEFDTAPNSKNITFKGQNVPLIPKEEIEEEEFDRMMEERYKAGSSFFRYADEHEHKRYGDDYALKPSVNNPIVWKVKCMVGKERQSVFCLMQKFVDLKSLGNKLQMISAFAVEHVKGHIFVEADKQNDIVEACRGLCSIYTTRIAPIPINDVTHLLSVRRERTEISEGTWARIKSGNYKGDLAQIVAVNDVRRRATVKLIPRIDLQALAEKFGGGSRATRKSTVPAPRLISSMELEEFRPLMEFRRDRDTGKVFEILDGMMLKDGYLYKRVAIDSLSIWGVTPSEDEILKFQPAENNESVEVEWLTQLYGDRKKKRTIKLDKGGEKGEGSSGSSSAKKFELYDLVCLSRKDFGLVVGIEKEDGYKILKEGLEGQQVLNVGVHDIKSGPFDGKFTAFDRHKKTISVNDNVRVVEGSLQDRQGIVKQIYRGILFIYDENEADNGGYICSRANVCEKVKSSVPVDSEKGGEPSSFNVFDDLPSSPKSPLSPEKPWQARENNGFNRGEKDGAFSIGQTLRIKIGPLKGYLCRVIAVRRSDVTVKLDSKQRVLTVKSEHLAEVHGKNSISSLREDPASSTGQPFDLLGNDGSSTDWMTGTGTGTSAGGAWNSGEPSAARGSWPSFPSGSKLEEESNSADPSSSVDVEDGVWRTKVAAKQPPSWGLVSSDSTKDSFGGNASGSWDKAMAHGEGSSKDGDSWGHAALKTGGSSWGKQTEGSSQVAADNWGKMTTKVDSSREADFSLEKAEARDSWGSWKKAGSLDTGNNESWDKHNNLSAAGSSWNKQTGGSTWNEQGGGSSSQNEENKGSWNKHSGKQDGGSSWGKQDGGSSWGKQDGGSSWGKQGGGSSSSRQDGGGSSWGKQDGAGSSWNKRDGGSSWTKDDGSCQNKQDVGSTWGQQSGEYKGEGSTWNKDSGGSSWNKQDGGSSRCKQDGGGSSWNKQDGGSSWGKQDGGGSSWNKQDSGPSWDKQDGGSSWTKDDDNSQGGGSAWNKDSRGSSWNKQGDGSSWGKQDGGSSSWNKQEGGSSWSKQDGGSSWSKQDGGSSWTKDDGNSQSKQDGGSMWDQKLGGSKGGGSTWNKDSGGSSWSKQDRGGSSWGKSTGGNEQGGGSWKKQDGGSSWGKQDGGLSWGKQDGGLSWGKQDGSQGGDDSNVSWSRPKCFDGDQGSGDWRRGGMGNRDNFEGRRGSGGRRGRGGGRFGRGRFFGRGRSFGSGNEGESWGRGKGERDAEWGKGGGSSCSKQDGGSSWSKQDGGSSWGKQDGGSSWGKQGGGSWSQSSGSKEGESWGKESGEAATDWGKGGGSSWSKQDGGSWSRQDGGSSWGKQGGGSWGQSSGGKEGESWGKGKGEAAADWVKAGGFSWNKQDGGSWSKPNDVSSWSKQGGGSWGQSSGSKEGESWGKGNGEPAAEWGKGGGSSWDKKDGGSKQNEGSSWGKQGGGSCDQSSGGKEGEFLSEGKVDSSANCAKGAASWNEQGGGSSRSKQEGSFLGGSIGQGNSESWSKAETLDDAGNSWNKSGGSWNKQDGSSCTSTGQGNGEGGSEGWNGSKKGSMGSKDDSGGSWGRPKTSSGGQGGW